MAIISCEELNKNYNGNCRKLVTDYMEEKPEIKKNFRDLMNLLNLLNLLSLLNLLNLLYMNIMNY